MKALAFVSLASALVVVAGGTILAHSGFENIVLAYVAATAVAAVASSAVMVETMRKAGSRLFARYI